MVPFDRFTAIGKLSGRNRQLFSSCTYRSVSTSRSRASPLRRISYFAKIASSSRSPPFGSRRRRKCARQRVSRCARSKTIVVCFESEEERFMKEERVGKSFTSLILDIFFFVKTRVKNTHERTKMVRGGAMSPRSLRVRYTVSQRLWWYRDHYACVCFLLALLSSRRYCWCCRRLRAAGVQFRQHVFLSQVRLKLSHSRG